MTQMWRKSMDSAAPFRLPPRCTMSFNLRMFGAEALFVCRKKVEISRKDFVVAVCQTKQAAPMEPSNHRTFTSTNRMLLPELSYPPAGLLKYCFLTKIPDEVNKQIMRSKPASVSCHTADRTIGF